MNSVTGRACLSQPSPSLISVIQKLMAIRYAPEKAKRKRGGGRPRSANPKAVLNIRVDPDVLARWKASGKGWQSRMNDILRANAP